jgi:NAD(P)-dependent dehydrogenase (short-subunit alcohol dehydrogenase family)
MDPHRPAEVVARAVGEFGDPREIAFAVAFLASPPSASTTGADFVVDSGMLKAS